MALTLTIKKRTWKKAITILLVLSAIIVLVGVVMKMNNHPEADLLLIFGPLPALLVLLMKWLFKLAAKPA